MTVESRWRNGSHSELKWRRNLLPLPIASLSLRSSLSISISLSFATPATETEFPEMTASITTVVLSINSCFSLNSDPLPLMSSATAFPLVGAVTIPLSSLSLLLMCVG
ncbi:hypothetical protein PIB30_118046 [Stylosanthes scabra]|uniref:Uncharacterized protein n=1 Tax=Stylosanthes scabra TaxID=79078 RepID=A0ABU6VHN6_9FABA|nr:hypothetical protein [Stylosanthes scabra]